MYIKNIVLVYFILLQGFSEEEISFAKAAFSNLIGGISYFHGSSLYVKPYLVVLWNYLFHFIVSVMAEGLKGPLVS